jgi:hypothetical protein
MPFTIFHVQSGSLPFQAPGTARWTHTGPWAGNRDHYFGYAVRPFQANSTAILGRVAATQDNNLTNTTTLDVTVESTVGGTLLKFTAIQVGPV